MPGAHVGPTTRHALVGRADLWAVKRQFQSEFLIDQGLRPEQRLLDIGCGTLRGGLPLIEYLDAGHYVGIEARASALEEAWKELAEAGLEGKSPMLIHADDPDVVSLDEPVQVAWAFSVLIHMEDKVVDKCLGLVARVLGEGGAFFANVILGDGPRSQWREFPVVPRPQAFYESLAARHALDCGVMGTLKALGYPKESEGGNGMMLRFSRSNDR
jgi:cyclopropane fatty-acyl-phospholipid synthase-like methyltransferase